HDTRPENWIYPALSWHPGPLNGSPCNSSSAEAEVLVAITGHGPTPPEGGTYCHWRGLEYPKPPITIYTRKARTRLLIRRLLICVLAQPPVFRLLYYV
ncbi:hypothetical protein AVEN_176301-1, partial [Araneus ventricosus]